MSEALDRGRGGLIRAATRAVLVAILVAPGCGGDDSTGAEPEPVDDASVDVAVRRDSAADTSPGREVSVEANLDRNVPPEQGADTSANRNDAGDASRDARDAAPGDGGAGDTLNLRDAAPEAPLPEAQAEARPPDAGADAAEDRQPSNDGATDAPAEVAPVVEASNADAVEADEFDAAAVEAASASEPEIESSTGSDADAATPDAESDDGSEAGSSLAPQSWVVGSGPVCVTGELADCHDDPDVFLSFVVIEQANNPSLCAAAPAMANLWFPSGDTLDPGSYDVLPASSLIDARSVPAGRVVVSLTEQNQATRWWGQMGTVVVTSSGGPPTITFDGVTANNGTTDALISGNVPCSP